MSPSAGARPGDGAYHPRAQRHRDRSRGRLRLRDASAMAIGGMIGGGIFSTLEQGDPRYADTFDRVFGTPHDRDLAALLHAHRVPATLVSDADALARALRTHGGVSAILAELPSRATLTPPGPDSPPST